MALGPPRCTVLEWRTLDDGRQERYLLDIDTLDIRYGKPLLYKYYHQLFTAE